MSDLWLFKDEAPVSPELQAVIDRTNEEIRSCLDGALRRSVKLANRGQWRPIETAPMDETAILVWGQLYGQQVVWWLEERAPGSGWASGEDLVYPYAAFTHWMPLPPDPPGT